MVTVSRDHVDANAVGAKVHWTSGKKEGTQTFVKEMDLASPYDPESPSASPVKKKRRPKASPARAEYSRRNTTRRRNFAPDFQLEAISPARAQSSAGPTLVLDLVS